MIHIFIGTKAQFIKMAPIIRELKSRDIPYNLIDTGQHAAITLHLADQFEIDDPVVKIRDYQKNVSTLFQAAVWSFQMIFDLTFRKKMIFEKIFNEEGGISLIHGDTLSTLFSLFYAKRSGIPVAHVEAGLRSFRLFDPFPEEIIRLISMRFSDVLFAPSKWAFVNLVNMGYQEKTINIGGNTVIDAIRYAQGRFDTLELPERPYVLATTHRVETIFSRKRMEFIVDLLNELSKERLILFVMHDPTIRKLEQYNLLEKVQDNPNIETLELQPYLVFLRYLENADFVITDGGSIQEETAYLNVPCIILRESTERQDGLSNKTILSEFDRGKINIFLNQIPNVVQDRKLDSRKPSADIVDFLKSKSY